MLCLFWTLTNNDQDIGKMEKELLRLCSVGKKQRLELQEAAKNHYWVIYSCKLSPTTVISYQIFLIPLIPFCDHPLSLSRAERCRLSFGPVLGCCAVSGVLFHGSAMVCSCYGYFHRPHWQLEDGDRDICPWRTAQIFGCQVCSKGDLGDSCVFVQCHSIKLKDMTLTVELLHHSLTTDLGSVGCLLKTACWTEL